MSEHAPLPFWQSKTLSEMDEKEWESLCDGCAKCCLLKLEDEETQEVFYTSLVCRYLEQDSCRCSDYQNRHELVPNCVQLKPQQVKEYHWLPSTCAYRLVAENKPLPAWHPLVSGDPNSVHDAGISVAGRVISEQYVHPEEIEQHIIHWVE